MIGAMTPPAPGSRKGRPAIPITPMIAWVMPLLPVWPWALSGCLTRMAAAPAGWLIADRISRLPAVLGKQTNHHENI